MEQTNNKPVPIFLLLAGWSLLLANSVSATDSLITVGIYQNQPKIYFDENQKPAGIFVDLLEEIARQENWKLEYISCSWNDCLQALENGEIDLLPDVALTYERTKKFSFNTVPVLTSWSQVYANPNTKITRFSDLADKNIALVEGSAQQPFFRQVMNGFGYQYHEVQASSFPDAFSEVKIGVADATVVNFFFGESQFEKYGLKRTPVIFGSSGLHFSVKRNENTWILEAIDRHIIKWQQTPESIYYKVLSMHTQPFEFSDENHENHENIYFYILTAGIFLLGVLFFLNFRNKQKRQNRELAQTNKKLGYEEKKFREYIEHAPYGVFVANEQGKYVDVNQTACNLTGFTKQELLGISIDDIIPDEGKELARRHFNAVVQESKASVIVPYLTKKGESRLWNVTAVKISPKRFIGFVEDVTEENETRNRMEMMSKIFNQSVNEIYLVDVNDFRFRYVNAAATNNLGYTVFEMEKMTPFDLKINFTYEEFEAIIQPLLNKEKKMIVLETPHYRKDGTFYYAEIYLQVLENQDEKLLSAVVLDITERKEQEKELQKIKSSLEKEVEEKTRELNERITELENFREATIERELRMEELRQEIERLKKEKKK